MATPESYRCSCQACGEHIEYPPIYEGTQIACPHCGQATLLRQPEIQATPTSAPAPPAMGSAPPSSASTEQVSVPDSDPEVDEESLSPVCENCGADMIPEDKVCVDCGHRRSMVSKWTGIAVFRLVAGIVILGELAVLGLQWTTEGKPFGLRKRTRHAVLVTVGLGEEVDPEKQAAMLSTNGLAPAATVAKDPDLKLKSHEKIKDKDKGSQWIKGVVQNISEYRYLAVRVRFNLIDAQGKYIPGAEVSDYRQSIEPGNEWPFKVLILDPDAVSYEPIMPIKGYR